MEKQNNGQQLVSQLKQPQSLTQSSATNWMFSAYPLLSQRKQSYISLYDAAKTETKSLSEIDAHFGEQISLKWLKAQLIEVLNFCGAFGVITDAQVILTARQIRNKYFYLTPAEFTFFFESFISGAYGVVYVGKTINPQTILQAVQKFDNDAINTRGLISGEREEERRQEEKRLLEEGKTGLSAWLLYCQKKGIQDQPKPMQGFLKEAKKKELNI